MGDPVHCMQALLTQQNQRPSQKSIMASKRFILPQLNFCDWQLSSDLAFVQISLSAEPMPRVYEASIHTIYRSHLHTIGTSPLLRFCGTAQRAGTGSEEKCTDAAVTVPQ